MKKIIYLLIMIGVFTYNLIAEENEEDIKNKLPMIQGISNLGNEFYFTIPPVYEETFGNNFVKIYITSSIVTNVKLEIQKNNKVLTSKTIPNDVIVFDLTSEEAQPFLYNPNTMKGMAAQKWVQAGIRITADAPIIVYVMCRYYYTSDGFLALPVSGLGREYIAATYNDMGWGGNQFFPPWVGITAAYDNTDIRINMGGNTNSEILTVDGAKIKPGQFIPRQRLQKGDVYMFSSNGPWQDVSGSKIVSNKPISVVSGHFCPNIPLTNQWCDYVVDMQLPTNTWGKLYHIPAYTPRRYSGIIRVFAKEDNTNVFRDGQFWFNLKKSVGIEGNGWKEERIWPKSQENGQDQRPKNAVISADKPIGITFYNPGTREDDRIINQADSDPFIMTMIPVEQYQNEITFCTPSVKGGDRFGRNFINVVYELNEFGLMPFDFEFGVIKNGKVEWKYFEEVFGGAGSSFTGGVNGKRYGSKQVLLPDDGVYKLRCKSSKFACYSYGFNDYESYGYPTSAALNDLTIPDVWAPEIIWSIDKKGNVNNGIVTDKPDNPALRSNLSIVRMDNTTSYNYRFEYSPFISGLSNSTNWKLTVLDKTKDARANLIFIDRSGNDTTITVSYKGIPEDVPLTFDYSDKICDSSIVVYEAPEKEYYKYKWQINGNYKLIEYLNNKILVQWIKTQSSIIRLIRENTITDEFDTLFVNIQVEAKPTIVENYQTTYCIEDTVDINLEFADSEIEYQNFIYEVTNNNEIKKRQSFNGIKPSSLNILNTKLPKGEYFVKYFYKTIAGCEDTVQFNFTVLENELKPRIGIEAENLIINNVVGNEYLWYRNDSLVERSTNNYFKPVLSGLYKCQITDENNCLSEFSNEVPIFINSIEENERVNIASVSKNKLEINHFDINAKINNFKVFDILGNNYTYTINYLDNTQVLNFAQNLKTGIYMLSFNINDKSYTYKFIINE